MHQRFNTKLLRVHLQIQTTDAGYKLTIFAIMKERTNRGNKMSPYSLTFLSP